MNNSGEGRSRKGEKPRMEGNRKWRKLNCNYFPNFPRIILGMGDSI